MQVSLSSTFWGVRFRHSEQTCKSKDLVLVSHKTSLLLKQDKGTQEVKVAARDTGCGVRAVRKGGQHRRAVHLVCGCGRLRVRRDEVNVRRVRPLRRD